MIGSTRLVETLIEHDLVDGFRLMIDPVLVGGGKGIFKDDGALRPLSLVESDLATPGHSRHVRPGRRLVGLSAPA